MSKTMNQSAADLTYNELVEKWGKEPTWEDFKEQLKNGQVQMDKTVASQIFSHGKVSPPLMITLLLWISILLPLGVIILYFIINFNAWYILLSAIISFFTMKISRKMQVSKIIHIASQDEKFYKTIMKAGGFKF